MNALDLRSHVAHADAWQAEGRLRAPFGGGAVDLPGARLSASGLPYAKWNSGDLVDGARFDPAAAADWYATRAFGAGVAWGVRMPAGTPFAYGRKVRTLRSMALQPSRFASVAPPLGVRFEVAGPNDAARVNAIDAASFDESIDEVTAWNTPHLGARGFTVVLAYVGERAVATATAVATDARAGPCVTLFGVGVLASARRRGIATAMTAWLIERAFDAGATLAHLNPNTPEAAAVYLRLGFVETQGMDVYVDI